MCKSLERKSAMIFSVTLIYWEYRFTLLLTILHPSHIENLSWPPLFTWSNYAVCIHPRVLEIYAKARIWDTCISFWMTM